MSNTMKQSRDNKFNYTKQGSDDMNKVRKLVADAWQQGIQLGYNPHEIFYEIVAEANTEFLMFVMSAKGKQQ